MVAFASGAEPLERSRGSDSAETGAVRGRSPFRFPGGLRRAPVLGVPIAIRRERAASNVRAHPIEATRVRDSAQTPVHDAKEYRELAAVRARASCSLQKIQAKPCNSRKPLAPQVVPFDWEAEMTASLESRLLRSNVREFGMRAVVLFAAAGTFRYWQAWTLLALHAVPVIFANVYMIRHDRELLRRRLAVEEEGETETVHKVFFALILLLGLALPLVAGLDRRFGWSHVPLPVVLGACAVSTAGIFLIYRVFRENTYCSSVIEIRENQTVVRTGPYRLVRHPMYASSLLGAGAMPLALGSYVAAAVVLPLVALLVVRILAEERFLSEQLPGYAAYMKATRKRLVPGLW